ncbi:MAG: arginine--tRNA ligase [Lachnospiraceae bacterium]|nr:arginine--tRNA ligase [Lachnospiraceae bacterium]
MNYLLDKLTDEVKKAFSDCGFPEELGTVTVSNRPDLCEFQCNGAMACAKREKKNPFDIAAAVSEKLKESSVFSSVEVVKPGFLNLNVSDALLISSLSEMEKEDDAGVSSNVPKKKIMVDYGGPNVAKPLHIGHLRSAIIGESIKRMGRFLGNEVTGDIHLGDWGLQMGLIIAELKERNKEFPDSISELEEIYPSASEKSKQDEAFKEKAMDETYKLQHGDEGNLSVWKRIMELSVADLKKNYERLNVEFDLWKGESDADPYIAPMVQKMKDEGFAVMSQGALVIDVSEEKDSKEVPPCMLLKSDGASLYTTTDLATLVERVKDYAPDQVIYVVDKRQQLHFTQVFRAAKKTGIVPSETELDFLGFGTMNGKDGKPFKTREGGVMRLETLLDDVSAEMYKKMKENEGISLSDDDIRDTSKSIALSAIKYGDLSNQASKDYIFDIDKFTSFEGNTGPYILYTMVRIKSILRKYEEQYGVKDFSAYKLRRAESSAEKALMLTLSAFGGMIISAFKELAPHRVCAYIYSLSNEFNRFYHETRILTESDEEKRKGWIALLRFTLKIFSHCIDLLGMKEVERM